MSERDMCDIYCYDPEKVDRVRRMLAEEDILRISQLFKVLADENRVRIVCALCREQELCVCDVANILGSSVATASHHLRTLRRQGVVKYRRMGKMAFYSLDNQDVKALISLAIPNQRVVRNGMCRQI